MTTSSSAIWGHRRSPPIPDLARAGTTSAAHGVAPGRIVRCRAERAVDRAAPAGVRGQLCELPTAALDNALRCPQGLGQRSALPTRPTDPTAISRSLRCEHPAEGLWIVPSLWTTLRLDHRDLDNALRCPHVPQPRRHHRRPDGPPDQVALDGNLESTGVTSRGPRGPPGVRQAGSPDEGV